MIVVALERVSTVRDDAKIRMFFRKMSNSRTIISLQLLSGILVVIIFVNFVRNEIRKV